LPEGEGQEGTDHIVFHPELDRFGIRFRGGKAVSYIMLFRIGGRENRHTIGKVKALSLTQARKLYEQKRGALAQPVPVDPNVERKQNDAVHSELFDSYVDRFLANQEANGISAKWIQAQTLHLKGYTDAFGRWRPAYFKAFHKTPVLLVTRKMVQFELDGIKEEHGHIAMSRARATLSKFFSFLLPRTEIVGNPVTGTEKMPVDKRTRWLTPAELKIIWDAADPNWEFGRIVRLIFLTGCRREQIGAMRKSWLQTHKKMIALPAPVSLSKRKAAARRGESLERRQKGGSKNNEAFNVHLSKQAIELLRLQPVRKDSDFVFGEGEGGYQSWSNGMEALWKRIGDRIDQEEHSWSLHDARRTFEKLAQDVLKIPPHITSATINHVPAIKREGANGHYTHAVTYWDERVAAMDSYGDLIEQIVGPNPPRLRLVA